ncbi:MAG: hypothetical protein N3D74_05365 [Caldisericia bacterium]|nr:hypothetical protein [Caldisericia bacterium]
MVKKIILIIILIIFLIFPPIIPKSLIKGDKSYLKQPFIFTYFNKNLKRESFFIYKIEGYEKRGVVLKNESSQKSYIFSSEGDFLSEGEINGGILIYFKENKEPKKHYNSIKNFHSSYIFFQDTLKNLNLIPYIDLEKDEIYLENEYLLVKIGRLNFKERIRNLVTLLNKEKINGIIDASFDKIIIIKGVKK